jgi:hypothetical protein
MRGDVCDVSKRNRFESFVRCDFSWAACTYLQPIIRLVFVSMANFRRFCFAQQTYLIWMFTSHYVSWIWIGRDDCGVSNDTIQTKILWFCVPRTEFYVSSFQAKKFIFLVWNPAQNFFYKMLKCMRDEGRNSPPLRYYIIKKSHKTRWNPAAWQIPVSSIYGFRIKCQKKIWKDE